MSSLDQRALDSIREEYPDLADAPDDKLKRTFLFAGRRLAIALGDLGDAIRSEGAQTSAVLRRNAERVRARLAKNQKE